MKFNPLFITALVAQLCSLCYIFGLKVTAYTVTEIQKTYKATGRGGLVVWFVFLFGGGFF